MIRRRHAVLGAVALVTACADTGTVDRDALGDQIPPALAPADPSVVADVDCPDELETSVGATITCTATVADDPVEISVEVLDDDGSVSVATDASLIAASDVAGEVADAFSDDLGVGVDGRCDPPAVRVASPGDVFVCTLTTDGVDRVVEATLAADGTVEVALR